MYIFNQILPEVWKVIGQLSVGSYIFCITTAKLERCHQRSFYNASRFALNFTFCMVAIASVFMIMSLHVFRYVAAPLDLCTIAID